MVSYSENPSHGRPSTSPPAKKSKQLLVTLEGGPRDGDHVHYGQPLPKTIVVHSKNAGWVDYQRKPNSTTYVYDWET